MASGAKRCAPVDCTHQQLSKRLRVTKMGSDADIATRCKHCGAATHTWSCCNNICLHCYGQHQYRRCPLIPIAEYVPGGFLILAQSPVSQDLLSEDAVDGDIKPFYQPVKIENEPPRLLQQPTGPMTQPQPPRMDGVCSERLAMISSTPEPVTLRPSMLLSAFGGPQQTASNLVPLATRQARTPSAAFQTSRPTNVDGGDLYEQQHVGMWSDLCQSVFNQVRGAQDPTRVVNHGRDTKEVDLRIREALAILKPAVMRPRRQK